jgi:hypothetical protein
MKLKQAFIIGLSSALLALPAIAAESAVELNKDATAMKPRVMAIPAGTKEASHHKKGHKKVSMEIKKEDEQAKQNAKLDELKALSESSGQDETENNQDKA